MQTVIKNLSELKRPNKNVRLHSDRQIKEYIRSIEMFGQIRPIVIDETNTILAGNGLFQALQQMGRETADCYVVGNLTAKQKKKLMLVDNKIFELGVNDTSTFDEILRELGGDVDIPGYDEDLLKTLIASATEANEIISSYGTVDNESIQQMKRAESQEPPQNQSSSAQQRSNVNVDDFFVKDDSPPTRRRYVTCPKCGERFSP